MKKLALLIINIILVLGVMSGCTSVDGMRLSKAMIKTFGNDSVQSDATLFVNIKTKEINIPEDTQKIIDNLNSSTIRCSSKSNISKNLLESNYSIETNGTTLNGNIYVDGQKIWVKAPLEAKYIEYDPSDYYSTKDSKDIIALQQQIRPLAMKFIKDYIAEYKYTFKNLTNKGKSTVVTPEGQVEVTNYELKLDTNEFTDLIKYTINNLSESSALKEYLKSVIVVTAQNNPEMLKDQTLDQILANFDTEYDAMAAQVKGSSAQIDQLISESKDYFEIGPQGIVYDIALDDNDNIVKTSENYNILIKNQNQLVNITLKSDSVNYNFNKTDVKIPTFNDNEIIKAKEFLSSPVFTDSSLGKAIGLNKKRIMLSIGNKEAYVNDEKITLDAEPYIKDESTMVPVKFIADSLGAEVNWKSEDQSIVYNDGKKEIIMQIGSKVAYVNGEQVTLQTEPVIYNEKAMIPLRFVSEQFGANVTWNAEYRTILIEK